MSRLGDLIQKDHLTYVARATSRAEARERSMRDLLAHLRRKFPAILETLEDHIHIDNGPHGSDYVFTAASNDKRWRLEIIDNNNCRFLEAHLADPGKIPLLLAMGTQPDSVKIGWESLKAILEYALNKEPT